MTKCEIIAFAGRKRSGKSMFANELRSSRHNTIIVSIADALKHLCCDILNMSYDSLNNMKNNGTTFSKVAGDDWVEKIHNATQIDVELIRKEIGGRLFTTVREMLQTIGTDLIRKYYPDWHIDKTIEFINSLGTDKKAVIIDDVRFPNEKAKIEAIGGDVYFVIRSPYWDVSNHSSETSLMFTDFETDHVLLNCYKKEDALTFFRDYFNAGYTKYNPIMLNNDSRLTDSFNKELLSVENADFIRKVMDGIKTNDEAFQHGFICFDSKDLMEREKFADLFYNAKNRIDILYVDNPLVNEVLKLYLK